MDRKQVPSDNVWVPGDVDFDTAVGLIAAYFHEQSPDTYCDRALVVHTKDISFAEGNLAAYAANENIGSLRGNGGEPGGPVLAIDPDVRLLEHAIKLADKQTLGLTESTPGLMSGWVAATRALNLATGERHPGVPDEIHQVLMDLKQESNNGYPTPKKGTAYKTMVELWIGKLKEHGYSGQFVASYLVASGVPDRSAENLQKIYH